MSDATPAPDPTSVPDGPTHDTSVEQVFRTSLRTVLWLLAGLTVLGVGIGLAVAGTAGLWGALIGVGLALVFSGTTIVAMLRTLRSSPAAMAGVVMGTWLAKVVVVVVVLALIKDQDFYSKPVLAVVLLVGVLGSAYLDYRAVTRAHVPYVEPAPAKAAEPGEGMIDDGRANS